MAVRPLWGGWILQMNRVSVVAAFTAAFLHQLSFGFLLPASLLLPQQLLGLQEDSGVDAASSWVSVPGALIAGVPWIVLGHLESLTWWVSFIPGVMGDGAGILPGLPNAKKGKKIIHKRKMNFILPDNLAHPLVISH